MTLPSELEPSFLTMVREPEPVYECFCSEACCGSPLVPAWTACNPTAKMTLTEAAVEAMGAVLRDKGRENVQVKALDEVSTLDFAA